MIAKVLFEFVIPFLLLGTLVWWLIKVWWFKFFDKSIDTSVEIKKKAKKYDRKLK
jgi:hypothetical protein